MKTLTLYFKITTFLLLIWMYQCFHNCDTYKTLIDKNILQTKNELKYERVLTEGDIAAKRQAYAEGCQKECSLDYEKNKWENLLLQENPYDRWQKVTNPNLFERFKKETSGMDPKWIDEKWNNEWNNISANKVSDLSSIFHRNDISEDEKEKLIFNVMEELSSLYLKFLDECKKEMRDNKSESESKIEMRENKTESECMNEQGKNKKKKKKSNILKFLFCRFDNH
ncbi:fam-g protein [Plasmodium gallinaceum]|uniref:Fam-g protein n=1 Tax=Plasmodium gallinaceum TaxID=5849 RepID=A0A1J1GZ21_PLAGA|nr:fam-g protein [Plasmodium gallinaceum]CRG96552.1 fam-g protein [Plasmodium gallinaceum]